MVFAISKYNNARFIKCYLILRVLQCQSECIKYADTSYIFLCIINHTISFPSPYMVKDWCLLQTVYSVLTFFKSWRWIWSLLRSTLGLIYIFSSFFANEREKSDWGWAYSRSYRCPFIHSLLQNCHPYGKQSYSCCHTHVYSDVRKLFCSFRSLYW